MSARIDPEDRLYELLPDFIRYVDALQGEPLRALMRVLQGQDERVRADLTQLYDNWFIETCEPWVVPYIAQLLGVRGLDSTRAVLAERRSLVAETIALRRSKGTADALARAAGSATGWYVEVVVGRRTVAATEDLTEPRPRRSGTVDLEELATRASLDGPFSRVVRSVDLSLPNEPAPTAGAAGASGPSGEALLPVDLGRFSPTAVSLFFWRLQSYPVRRGACRKMLVRRQGAGRGSEGEAYTFHPFGLSVPLFELPAGSPGGVRAAAPDPAERDAGRSGAETSRAEITDVPAPLTRHTLARWLLLQGRARKRTGQAAGETASVDPRPELPQAPVTVLVQEPGKAGFVPVPYGELEVRDLSRWEPPGEGYRVAVDPELGRLVLAPGAAGRQVRASYQYGACGDYGGGPYARPSARSGFLGSPGVAVWSAPATASEPLWEAAVSTDVFGRRQAEARSADPETQLYPDLRTALAAWPETAPRARISILDSAAYGVSAPGRARASAEPRGPEPLIRLGGGRRELILEAGMGEVPCLIGTLEAELLGEGCRLVLAGVWLDGGLRVRGSGKVELQDTTLLPHRPGRGQAPFEEGYGVVLTPAGPEVSPGEAAMPPRLDLQLDRSLVGPISLVAGGGRLVLRDSIVDGGAGPAVQGSVAPAPDAPRDPDVPREGEPEPPPGAAAWIERCTLFGPVYLERLDLAENVLFVDPLRVFYPWVGRLSHSHVPPGSRAPQALDERTVRGQGAAAGPQGGPVFTSRTFGHPAYAQLADRTPEAIRSGGTEGSEIGVFHQLFQPQRRAMLPIILDEYVPWGFIPRVAYVN